MAAVVTISSKNQVVVPAEVRKALQVKPGDKLLFVLQGERVLVLEKAKSARAALRGLAKDNPYPKNYLKQERESWE